MRTGDLDYNRVWGAMMLTPKLEVCRSILRLEPVLAGQLSLAALRRALRGGPLPRPDAHVLVSLEMLDAVVEGGPFQ